MAKRDYYEILGLSRNDSAEEVRKAFRKKALEYHPDRNKDPNAEERFKEVNEAYQILSDSEKRARYDRFGHVEGNFGNGFDRPFDGFDIFGGFGDIFDSFFGGNTAQRAHEAQRGSDLQQKVVLSFEEAVFGAERELEINRLEPCARCAGAGNEPGTTVDTCGTCRGSGQVRRTQKSLFGQFSHVSTCPTCQGRGQVISTPCSTCRGGGMERRKRKTVVRIPAGVEAGMQVRLTGEGDVGRNGGPPGNLYIRVDVKEHPQFTREDFDLVYDLPLNVFEAALGVEKEIPTLDGASEVIKIPAGTQPGTEFRIRGKGVPHLRSQRRGDLRVIVDLEVPKSLNSRQRRLLEELAQTFKSNGRTAAKVREDEAPTPEADEDEYKDKGLFDRIKDAFG